MTDLSNSREVGEGAVPSLVDVSIVIIVGTDSLWGVEGSTLGGLMIGIDFLVLKLWCWLWCCWLNSKVKTEDNCYHVTIKIYSPTSCILAGAYKPCKKKGCAELSHRPLKNCNQSPNNQHCYCNILWV